MGFDKKHEGDMMRGNIERQEQILVKMTCEDVTPRMAQTIRELFKGAVIESVPGAIANFTFDFSVQYFNVVKQMHQIEVLLDTGKVKLVSTEELIQAKCLAQDFFNKIEALERRLKEKGG